MSLIYTKKHSLGIDLQAPEFEAISPSNSTTYSPSALFVGTGGNVAVKGVDGTTTTFKNIPSGSFLPLLVVQVLATGTTASDIIRLK